MSLVLGKSFDRNYSIRLSLLNSYFDIGIFYNSKSSFLLFDVSHDLSKSNTSYKINTFKNIESSSFVETFLDLYSFKNNSLDIINQFKEIKEDYKNDIILFLNENIILSKITSGESVFYDQLIIYGLTLSSYDNQFSFILTERQNIISKLKKKIVRTSALQIASSDALSLINEYKGQKNV